MALETTRMMTELLNSLEKMELSIMWRTFFLLLPQRYMTVFGKAIVMTSYVAICQFLSSLDFR